VGPGLAAQLFRTSNVILAGIGAIVIGLSAALFQIIFHRTAPWIGAVAGSAALAVGAGFGVAFLGGLRELAAVIPDQHRAGDERRSLAHPPGSASR
jgi:hypothetical protein